MLIYQRARTSKNAFLRQHVGLTGLGSESFAASIKKLQEIHTILGTSYEEDAVHPWDPPTYLDYGETITASSRYFTLIQESPNEVSVPFGYMVDPGGRLKDMMGDILIHGSDNNVLYYGYKGSKEGKHR